MPKADTLIRTKLRLPFTRSGLVSRPRLQEQIRQGLCGPLTLVTAPAGFGKTTLVAEWVESLKFLPPALPGARQARESAYPAQLDLQPSNLEDLSLRAKIDQPATHIAWLSLDKDDNQVERFLSYLIAALQVADPTIGGEAIELMIVAQHASTDAVLTGLINDLDAAHREIALVLDDYQFISSQAVHDQVAFLLEHCPKTFHLVIASRSDPPLPLARLRARGQVVELRAADLSFNEPEAAQFLNEVMGLGLDADSVARLAERTEGWIAGLQMAALSMRDRKDISVFIESFSGTNRYILDYLLEEVLANQPPEIQHFLLYTSILERLSAPLCDAVMGSRESRVESGDGSPLSALDSQSILEYLERANLFLVPLDDERQWYRYHRLFADLLHARLQQTISLQDIALLHQQAAQWYEQNGLTLEAIHHASLTSNNEWVERLIEQNYMEMGQRKEFSSLRFWTGKLSKQLVYKRPRLCIHEAMSCSWFGKLDEADELLAQAEEHIQKGNQAPETQSMLGYIAFVKSRVTAMRGDVRRSIELSLTARENTPASNQALLAGIGVMLGYGYFLGGDFTNAIQTFNETIQSGITSRANNSAIGAHCVLARVYAIQGQLHRPYELYREAAKLAHEMGGQNLGAMAVVDVGIADVLYEWNDLEAALTHVKQGLEFIRYWGKADDIALAYTTLARIHQAKGNTTAAVETIEKGSQVIQKSGVFSEARDAVATTEVRLWLAQGNSLAAGRWSDSLEIGCDSGDPFRFENELAHMTLARVYLDQKKLDKAIELLSRLEANAQSGRRTGRLIEILILQAMALQKLGEPAQALEVLARSLALAEPEGYIRVFLNEGRPMQTLLAQWLGRASAGPLYDYSVRLLSQFEAELKGSTKAQEKASPVGDLIEPLSQRELEVLHLIALGKTNQEIAAQLIVSPGTVKAHTASIYRKLDVANRTEAVARARQIGILP